MLIPNLLLHWPDEKLGDLRGAQLIPGKGCVGSRLDGDSDGMSQVVDRQQIWRENSQ